MDRLTYRDGHGEAWYSGGTPADHLHRLADYEDLELTPEEVAAMKQELAKIEAAKPPIKPGDYVYWILYDDEPYVSIGDKVGEVGTMGFFVGDNYFDGTTDTDNLIFFPFDVLGKNCFLTQEEAEAALAKDNNVPTKEEDTCREW